ncbi:hypothetical protein TIFTF001_032670 [Ficus carica]|uniref:EF-hand domain-containing protein n=1 Tax=Ficus carica TaxID=3494 RepID=A0AA88E3T9_FICCA|nr:hypothetical protein TIFTF001_032670 [Ficus carica]
MGNTSSMLTQYDIEEVQQHCNGACETILPFPPFLALIADEISQQEIVSLYQRFCQLDRNVGGFITAEEFLSVPEFAVNPLSQRLLRMLDTLNFKEFVAFLSAFSPRASLQQKIEFIFKVYDSDCNGKVTFSDMMAILRDLTGQFISEKQREQVLAHVLEESGYTKDAALSMSDFMKILDNSDLKMEVEVPVD